MKKWIIPVFVFCYAGCSGIKVVKPSEPNKNQGTKMLDLSGGQIKIVSTYTCNLESQGEKFSAVGKTEADARKEVLARCRDHALLTFCKPEKISCLKN